MILELKKGETSIDDLRPLKCKLLKSAEVADTTLREKASFEDVKFFLERYPAMMPNDEDRDLEREFSEYLEIDLPDYLIKNTLPDDVKRDIASEEKKRIQNVL